MPSERVEPRAFFTRAGEGKTTVHIKQGEVIFKQGNPADLVYYLQSGKANETFTSKNGKNAVVSMLEAGNLFGISSLFGEKLRSSSVTTITNCVVTSVSKDAMRKTLQDGAFAQFFMGELFAHSARMEAEKVDLLLNSSEQRLAQRLLALSHISDGVPQVIGPEVTQEILAEMIGTTRPRVNFFLNKFRREGLIRYRDGILVQPSLLTAVMQHK